MVVARMYPGSALVVDRNSSEPSVERAIATSQRKLMWEEDEIVILIGHKSLSSYTIVVCAIIIVL